ncbi:MAG: helix-turn-helix transcriptional regulator [Magnetococcales bacterium]|nr:helix-turn-helix transcriptional regulator [Magnetococcales bacterium]
MDDDDCARHVALHDFPMRLVYAKALEGSHSLALAWDRGERGVVSLDGWVKSTRGVRSLLDPVFFAKCAIIDDGWSLGWPGDISMGWDQLYILAVDQLALRSTTMTGDQFRAWLAKHGLTQTLAAKHLGMTPKTINNYVTGHAKIPRSVQLACLAIDAQLVPVQ